MSVELGKNNRYIKLFNSCYTTLSEQPRSNEVLKKTKLIKTSIFSKGIEETETVLDSFSDTLKEVKEKIEEAIEDEFRTVTYIQSSTKKSYQTNIVRNFDQMWEFAQFVRYAEKVIFYTNDTNKALYVDSDLLDEKCRAFSINSDDYNIIFKMEKKIDINDEEIDIIVINVNRRYGKMMNNQFTIVNENVKFTDISDNILIDSINNLLYDATYIIYTEIFNKLLTFFKELYRWEV